MNQAFFDEMTLTDGGVRGAYRPVADWLKWSPPERLRQKATEAEVLFRRLGITFVVYGSEGGTERLIPFDIIPRVFNSGEWQTIADGVIQRVRALNFFLADVYGNQEIVRGGSAGLYSAASR